MFLNLNPGSLGPSIPPLGQARSPTQYWISTKWRGQNTMALLNLTTEGERGTTTPELWRDGRWCWLLQHAGNRFSWNCLDKRQNKMCSNWSSSNFKVYSFRDNCICSVLSYSSAEVLWSLTHLLIILVLLKHIVHVKSFPLSWDAIYNQYLLLYLHFSKEIM